MSDVNQAEANGASIRGETPLPVHAARVQSPPPPQPEGNSPKDQPHTLSLNFDVLFLIARNIRPIDLLNLARTNKSFRTLLMKRSSTFVWKATQKNVQPADFPGCPADLSEPQYVELVFGTACHGCGQTAHTVFWKMRRRYCSDCRKHRFRRVALCEAVIRNCDVVPVEWCTIDDDRGYWVDVDQMNAFLDELGKSSNKEAFLEDTRQRYAAIQQHANMCEYWERQVHSEREKSILERLEQSGYGKEWGSGKSARQSAVSELRPLYPSAFRGQTLLTDEEWDGMNAKWMDIMEDRQRRREKLGWGRKSSRRYPY